MLGKVRIYRGYLSLMVNKAKRLYNQALKEALKKTPNLPKVMQLLNNSIELGSCEASYALATWYLHGHNVKKNYKRAVLLLNKAIEGNILDALFDLAICYEKGTGVKQNKKKKDWQFFKHCQSYDSSYI